MPGIKQGDFLPDAINRVSSVDFMPEWSHMISNLGEPLLGYADDQRDIDNVDRGLER